MLRTRTCFCIFLTVLFIQCANESKRKRKKASKHKTETISPYALSGTVTNLKGNGFTIQNNGADLLNIARNTFYFAGNYPEGSAYSVKILAQPESPFQTCTLIKSNGTFFSANGPYITAECIDNPYDAPGLKLGDTPPGFTLPIYEGFGATLDFSKAAFSNKVTLLSFVDIDIFNADVNKSWKWIEHLHNIKSTLGSSVDIILIVFNMEGNITDADITNKLAIYFVNISGFTTLRDNTWNSSVAKIYSQGFYPATDSSFNGGTVQNVWTYIISNNYYITDKWYKNSTINGEPVSYNRHETGPGPFDSADFTNTETYVKARLQSILSSAPY